MSKIKLKFLIGLQWILISICFVVFLPIAFFGMINIFDYVWSYFLVGGDFFTEFNDLFEYVGVFFCVALFYFARHLVGSAVVDKLRDHQNAAGFDVMKDNSNIAVSETLDTERLEKVVPYFSSGVALLLCFPLLYFFMPMNYFTPAFFIIILVFLILLIWCIYIYKNKKVKRTYYPETQHLIDIVFCGGNKNWGPKNEEAFLKISQESDDYEVALYYRHRALCPSEDIACRVKFDSLVMCLKKDFRTKEEIISSFDEFSISKETPERVG